MRIKKKMLNQTKMTRRAQNQKISLRWLKMINLHKVQGVQWYGPNKQVLIRKEAEVEVVRLTVAWI